MKVISPSIRSSASFRNGMLLASPKGIGPSAQDNPAQAHINYP